MFGIKIKHYTPFGNYMLDVQHLDEYKNVDQAMDNINKLIEEYSCDCPLSITKKSGKFGKVLFTGRHKDNNHEYYQFKIYKI